MDLAVVVLLLGCLWPVASLLDLSRMGEALLLLGGSLVASGWLAWRVRRTLQRVAAQRPDRDTGPGEAP